MVMVWNSEIFIFRNSERGDVEYLRCLGIQMNVDKKKLRNSQCNSRLESLVIRTLLGRRQPNQDTPLGDGITVLEGGPSSDWIVDIFSTMEETVLLHGELSFFSNCPNLKFPKLINQPSEGRDHEFESCRVHHS